MRTRTHHQKRIIREIRLFYGSKGVRKPFRDEMNKKGEVEITWLFYTQEDRMRIAPLGALLDFAEERDCKVEWRQIKEVPWYAKSRRYSIAAMVLHPTHKCLTITVPME